MIVVININMKLAFLILGFIVSAVSMVRREARDGEQLKPFPSALEIICSGLVNREPFSSDRHPQQELERGCRLHNFNIFQAAQTTNHDLLEIALILNSVSSPCI